MFRHKFRAYYTACFATESRLRNEALLRGERKEEQKEAQLGSKHVQTLPFYGNSLKAKLSLV